MLLLTKIVSEYDQEIPQSQTAGRLKVKGQGFTLKFQSQSECQTGWEKENLKSHH